MKESDQKMKVTILEPKEYTAKYLDISVPIRFDDEDMSYDAPFRDGDMWNATVDLESKSIVDWPQGKTLSFFMKVVDMGTYVVRCENKNVILSIVKNYVPNSLIPGEYGDYIELDINEDGVITNWSEDASFDEFYEEIRQKYERFIEN